MHFVPIKRVLGDYFLTEINKQIYCFKIDGSRIMFYQETAVKSFRVLLYSINHFCAISPEKTRELEAILEKNTLPNVDRTLLNIFKFYGKQEKRDTRDFKPHNLSELFTEAEKTKENFPTETNDFVVYLKELKKDEIITPVKNISEFLDSELILPDPRFFGTVISQNQRVEVERKLVANKPIGPKHAWLKMALIGMIIAMAVGGLAYGYSQGWFNNVIPNIGSFGGGTSTTGAPTGKIDQATLLKEYPTPDSMVTAIKGGMLSCGNLTPDIVKMVNNFKAHTC